ncbi:ferritin-like domain-containing protein [Corallococcus llansteffanensis]|uniref:Ferritin-like domain-containing protein n=1 Tax=Corallococcus llansteffanensis TaxID=2316731 RepID=A0A3A8P4L4_9BACT|nr:ferritin-like domain-containing protein [Corallococcus llansteffanensis]RKH50390.1 ferritin-like domain-containing protein [Corallococcus llansteffanensis]
MTCDGYAPSLGGLTISPAPDLIQLRGREKYLSGEPPHFWTWPVASQGQPCATATDATACQAALEAADPIGGLHYECGPVCSDRFLVTTRGDEVKTYPTLESIQGLLGTVDTQQEAVLLAFAAGNKLSCTELEHGAVKTNEDGTFNVIGTQGSTCGKDTALTQHVVKVFPSGEVREVERYVLKEGDPNCTVGRRPVGLQVADACESTDVLGQYFAEAAHLEAASVHAFLRLREELALHGAGPDLQDAARRSALDEVLHTDVTGRIARRFGATPQRPVVAALPLRPLIDVALDNAVEGCVRETYGALLAHHQALHAQDAEVREAMVRIAADETRHAGLSWDIDQWVRPRLSAPEREALREAQRQAVALLRSQLAVPPDAGLITAAGLPTPEVALSLLDTLEQELWA